MKTTTLKIIHSHPHRLGLPDIGFAGSSPDHSIIKSFGVLTDVTGRLRKRD